MSPRPRARRKDSDVSKETATVKPRRLARFLAIATAALAATLSLAAAPAADAAPGPAWQLSLTPLPTNLTPGSTGTTAVGPMYALYASNVGGAATTGTVTFGATLPAGLTAIESRGNTSMSDVKYNPSCSVAGQEVTCSTDVATYPGRWTGALIPLKVSSSLKAKEVLTTTAYVEGGGAATVTAGYSTEVETAAPPFDFLPGAPGLSSLFTNPDGSAAAEAGSHPGQFTLNVGFPIAEPVPQTIGAAGHLRTQLTDLPRGVIVNPQVTPVRCTELELTSDLGCPPASQIGLITILTKIINIYSLPVPLYNMVPPPGAPAMFGFNAINDDIYVHLEGEVRSDGDYGLSAHADDIIARTLNPIMSVQAQLWGDPSAGSHAESRGDCRFGGDFGKGEQYCGVAQQSTAFLTMPSQCSSGPISTTAGVESWDEPGVVHHRSAPSTDVEGNPVGIEGCAEEPFEPTITSRPTTNAADAPTGLDFDLHQPQDQKLHLNEAGEPEGISPANLRDAIVALPEGVSLNPSSANGLGACSEPEVGYLGSGHYSKQPDSCPDASKVGRLEVTTPLLDHALHGSVYVAEPYENQFGSLLAIYLSINDPQSGTVAKLAGKVTADPQTGQLTTAFTENPELPLEDVKLHLFAGAGAALRTPSTCGNYTTTSDLTPWSAPAGEVAHPTDSFQTTEAAGEGACPTEPSAAPNSPSFEAGAESPIAGKYSPLVLHLRREDGSQQFSRVTVTPPPGFTGKLAGIPYCSDAALATAAGKSGAEEKAHPDCSGASRIGAVHVAAGAGPAPYWAQGTAYLSGPYKGAPLSMSIVTPATAGPYDLGTVVTRVALHLDPATAQITADADPVPSILHGIPLDVRSIDVSLDKPDFSRTGTSCDPFSVDGQLISTLGQGAELHSPYQLGNCANLGFKPHMTLKLKGATRRTGHPELIATVFSKGTEEANLSRVQVKLPRSSFLDQAHIRTVCTRVQFAAGGGNGEQCPAGSVYGQAWVKTPLFDYTIGGRVFLRSSNHKLPDLVIALQGPASQPIAIELDGRTDSVKGALRNTFEAVPDQPFERARVVLFGGKKRGLVVNSRNLCAQSKRASRANVQMDAQSGKSEQLHPLVRNSCRKAKRKAHKHHHRHRSRGKRRAPRRAPR